MKDKMKEKSNKEVKMNKSKKKDMSHISEKRISEYGKKKK